LCVQSICTVKYVISLSGIVVIDCYNQVL